MMAIDERFRRQWRAEQERRQTVRNVSRMLRTFGPREGEDDAAYGRRMARQNHLHALETDAREDVANDDDVTLRV